MLLKWTPEEKAAALAMRAEGHDLRQIAERFNRTAQQVDNLVRRERMKLWRADAPHPEHSAATPPTRKDIFDSNAELRMERGAAERADLVFIERMAAVGKSPSAPKQNHTPIARTYIDRPATLSASDSSMGGNFI